MQSVKLIVIDIKWVIKGEWGKKEIIFLHRLNNFQDIDYILWTGDLPPHDVWNQTREENLKVLRNTVAQMIEMFPGIPIFPALGNHESSPVNRYISTYLNSPLPRHFHIFRKY